MSLYVCVRERERKREREREREKERESDIGGSPGDVGVVLVT